MILYISLPGERDEEFFTFVEESRDNWGKGDLNADFRSLPTQGTTRKFRVDVPRPNLFSHFVADINKISSAELQIPTHANGPTNICVSGTLTISFNSIPRKFAINSEFDTNGKAVIWNANPATQSAK